MPEYVRPIRSRYLDPVELVWFATAKRFGLTVRRNPDIFSMTDGAGKLELGPRTSLDADDSAAQMIFHEFCHWITNGEETIRERDWGFPLWAELDWREHACLRLQAALAGEHGLRGVLAPTSQFREYYDALPDDPFGPMAGWPDEEQIVPRARESFARAHAAPFGGPLSAALAATAKIHRTLGPFLRDYATDVEADELPSLWGR